MPEFGPGDVADAEATTRSGAKSEQTRAISEHFGRIAMNCAGPATTQYLWFHRALVTQRSSRANVLALLLCSAAVAAVLAGPGWAISLGTFDATLSPATKVAYADGYTVTVCSTNTDSAAGWGGITLSFPDRVGQGTSAFSVGAGNSGDGKILPNPPCPSGTSPCFYPTGSNLWTKSGTQKKSSYPMAEWQEGETTNSWTGGEKNCMAVKVKTTAADIGKTETLLYRGWWKTASGTFKGDPVIGTVDQQGWNAHQAQVSIVECTTNAHCGTEQCLANQCVPWTCTDVLGYDYPCTFADTLDGGDCSNDATAIYECIDTKAGYCWAFVKDCPSGTTCTDPVFGGPSCESDCPVPDACQLKSTKCATPGAVQTCVPDANGCPAWSAPSSCGSANKCVSGSGCVPKTCTDIGYPDGACNSAGDTMCSSNFGKVLTCSKDATTGLSCWSATATCSTNSYCYKFTPLSTANCVGSGSDDFCAAKKGATNGAGCAWGEGDCDKLFGECQSGLECTSPTVGSYEGCCKPGEKWNATTAKCYTCPATCTPGSQPTCNADGTVSSCGTNATTGCPEVKTTSCSTGQKCSSGTCVAKACADYVGIGAISSCNSKDATTCSGNELRTCSVFGGATLCWVKTQTCTAGKDYCQAGATLCTSCPVGCAPGKSCDGKSTLVECKADVNGCNVTVKTACTGQGVQCDAKSLTCKPRYCKDVGDSSCETWQMLNVPFRQQYDYSWCWAASASMIATHFGVKGYGGTPFMPWHVALDFKKAPNQGLYGLLGFWEEEKMTDYYNTWLKLPSSFKAYGFLPFSVFRGDVQHALDVGKPVKITFKYTGTKNFDHAVVAVGYSSDSLFVHDPSGALTVMAFMELNNTVKAGLTRRLQYAAVPWSIAEQYFSAISTYTVVGNESVAPVSIGVQPAHPKLEHDGLAYFVDPKTTSCTLGIQWDGTAPSGYRLKGKKSVDAEKGLGCVGHESDPADAENRVANSTDELKATVHVWNRLASAATGPIALQACVFGADTLSSPKCGPIVELKTIGPAKAVDPGTVLFKFGATNAQVIAPTLSDVAAGMAVGQIAKFRLEVKATDSGTGMASDAVVYDFKLKRVAGCKEVACADYPGQCSASLPNGCGGNLNCSTNCGSSNYCDATGKCQPKKPSCATCTTNLECTGQCWPSKKGGTFCLPANGYTCGAQPCAAGYSCLPDENVCVKTVCKMGMSNVTVATDHCGHTFEKTCLGGELCDKATGLCKNFCGNGICDTAYSETCSTCPQDCKAVCGDGKCTNSCNETCTNCATDCGPCPASCGQPCVAKKTPGCQGCGCESCVCNADEFCCKTAWDDLCVSECKASPCAGSCAICGDGICASDENATNCKADCAPASPDTVSVDAGSSSDADVDSFDSGTLQPDAAAVDGDAAPPNDVPATADAATVDLGGTQDGDAGAPAADADAGPDADSGPVDVDTAAPNDGIAAVDAAAADSGAMPDTDASAAAADAAAEIDAGTSPTDGDGGTQAPDIMVDPGANLDAGGQPNDITPDLGASRGTADASGTSSDLGAPDAGNSGNAGQVQEQASSGCSSTRARNPIRNWSLLISLALVACALRLRRREHG